jgi:hypothetical protein
MKILNRLQFSECPTVIATPDGIAEVKPYQIVLTVSLAPRTLMDPPVSLPRFPAILDTGMNHDFCIRQEHFSQWAKLEPRLRSKVRVRGEEVPLLAGNVWVHPNRPGTTELSGEKPFRLEMSGGFIVYPEVTANPARLPILGLRVIVRNHLRLIVDGTRCEVTLKTPGWF